MSDPFLWNTNVQGDWANPDNWSDTATIATPAATAPGASNAVTIDAVVLGTADVITGTGQSASLTFGGTVDFDGTFTTGSITEGQNAIGGLALGAGDSLTVTGTADLRNYGTSSNQVFQVSVAGAGSRLNVDNQLMIGDTTYESDNSASLNVAGGGFVQAGVSLFFSAGQISVDNQSTIEVGTSGGAPVGGITVDAGAVLGLEVSGLDDTVTAPFIDNNGLIMGSIIGFSSSELISSTINNTGIIDSVSITTFASDGSGGATGTLTNTGSLRLDHDDDYATAIVNNGLIVAYGAPQYGNGSVILGAITGIGKIQIAAAAELTLEQVSSGNSVNFTGNGATLILNSGSFDSNLTFDPVITGFNPTDTIVFNGTLTGTTYAAGVLTLMNGTTVVGKLNIAGLAAGSQFVTTVLPPDGATGQIAYTTQIALSAGGDTATAPAGTASADTYAWGQNVAGSWDGAANWQDSASGTNLAALAPGATDAVTIPAEAGGTIDVISGVGAARALTVLGAVDLTGSVTTGALVLNGYSSVLSLGNRASLSVSGGVSDAIGTFDIAGGSLDVGGAWTSNVYDDVNGLVYGGTDIRVHDGGSLVVGGAFDTLGTTSEFRGSEYLWAVDGNITLDGALNVTASAAGENILVGDAGRISALSLNANGASASLYIGVDATSSLEIGTSKTAAAGSITIDSGATASVTSGFWDAPEIAVNGTISVLAGAQLTIFGTGASQDLSPLDYYIAGFVDYFHNPSTAGDGLTGTGTIQLGAGAQLGIAGVRLDAAFTIALSGGADTLVIGDNSLNASNIFVPTITGFNSGDVIDLADLTYKSSYRLEWNANAGTATVIDTANGDAVLAALKMTGVPAGAVPVVYADADGNTQILLMGSEAGDAIWVGGNGQFASATDLVDAGAATALSVTEVDGSRVDIVGNGVTISMGNADNLGISGMAETVTATGSGDNIWIGGNGQSAAVADKVLAATATDLIVTASANSNLAVLGEAMSVYLGSSDTLAVTGGDNFVDASGSGEILNLSATAGSWDDVTVSGAAIDLTGAQATIFGGGNTIGYTGGTSDTVGLYGTNGIWDSVSGAVGGTVYLTGAQAAVTGGGNAISFVGATGNVVGLYATGGIWDSVWAPEGGTIYLTGAQAAVAGGDDTISFAGGTGNIVGLYDTDRAWDSVWAPGGETIYLTSAQAAVTGGGDTISFAGGTGNVVGLYDTGGSADTIWAPGGETIYFTSAQAVVTGGGDAISFAGGTGNAVTLTQTNGTADTAWATSGLLTLVSAQVAITGSNDTVNFRDGSTATLDGTNETLVFAAGIGGHDVVTGWSSTDTLQLSASTFTDWAHLLNSGDIAQVGADTVITLDGSDSVKLTGVTASTLTPAQVQFV
ncbi:beta strand repeat-containing protein [Novosphingobium sp.]|uniref:beta strand repeat-containing protein n=1 Tax=Novosphingobium sp. TaxID=1874826 RepID=UPI003B52E56A